MVDRLILLCFLFSFSSAAMKREVRPSRFQVGSIAGVPPPKARPLVFISPFFCGNEPQARKLEDEERQKLARAWVVCA